MPERPFSRSLADAVDGVLKTFREQRNFRVQAVIAIAVGAAAAWLRFDAQRWAILALTIGVVLAAELLNTALERAVDCASPGESDAARAAKHAGAAAVLIASLSAIIVGAALFGSVLWKR